MARYWSYQTTSGTLLTVRQEVLGHGDDLPAPIFAVEIPEDRRDGFHHTALSRVINGSTYFDWYSLYESVEETPAFEEARRRGMAIASDPEDVAAREARKAEPKSKRISDPEEDDWDPFDDGVFDEDDLEYRD